MRRGPSLRVLTVADAVHVALAPVGESGAEDAACTAQVSGAPATPLTVRAMRVQERLAARTLLRELLAELVGDTVAALPVASGTNGKPWLPGQPELAVSLSHSGGWVAAGVNTGGGAIGIDAQAAEPVSSRMVRRCCTEPVGQRLSTLPPPARALEFAWIWSAQEACVKATGAGLSGLPWTIPVGIGQRHGRWRNLRWTALRDQSPLPVSCAYEPTVEVIA